MKRLFWILMIVIVAGLFLWPGQLENNTNIKVDTIDTLFEDTTNVMVDTVVKGD